MSDSPKPPDGYATWLDWHLAGPLYEERDAPLRGVCRTELAALRAERGRLRDLVRRDSERLISAANELTRLRAERDAYKAALQRIAAGRTTEDRVAGEDHAYEMCAGRLCGIARDTLRHKELAK